MSDDLKTRLDDAVDPVAPFGVDVDLIIAGERRRKRRVTAGSGAIAVVLALAFVVGAGVGGIGRFTERAAGASDHVESPTPDPRPRYLWSDSSYFGVDAAYTRAFWDHMSAEWPDLHVDAESPLGTPGAVVAGEPPIGRTPMSLRDTVTGDVVIDFEYLRLFQVVRDPDGTTTTGPGVVWTSTDGPIDTVDVEVFPANTYTVGDSGILDLLRCTPFYDRAPCADRTTVGADGDGRWSVDEIRDTDGTVIERRSTVVLTRSDGSAVRVTDRTFPENGGDIEGVPPVFSPNDLLAIAAALPETFP